ncbi:MAG: hypothetical protein J6Y76_03210 [Paludibacteraceae bacterium]|nr:hypothetical protein [Paludibacteraceae bacterium]
MKKLLYIPLVLSLSACTLFNEHRARFTGGDDVVAELGSHKLYRSELEAVTSMAVDNDDSVQMADAYIRQWATDLLFYEKANAREDAEVEALVEDYRRSLYLHRYEERLIERKMPKSVHKDSIRAFYEANQDLFLLREDILKGVLMIVPTDAPHPERVKKWLAEPEENIQHIEKYAYQYASGYQLFTKDWVSGNQILIRMPFDEPGFASKLRSNDYIEMRDSTSLYMLRITDKHFVGEPMPLEYADPQIRAVILQKRQVDFIRGYRDALYEDAVDRKLKVYR